MWKCHIYRSADKSLALPGRRQATCTATDFDAHTGWAKSRYTVFFFFFTGVVNDGRELKYRTKKVDVKQLKLNVKLTNVNI